MEWRYTFNELAELSNEGTIELAKVEALREIAEQLAELNQSMEDVSPAIRKVARVTLSVSDE